jgi:HK97 family phage portal protein
MRADMISSLPLECVRTHSDGLRTPVTTPDVLINPASHGDGQPIPIDEWLYSSQADLDRLGNSYARIDARNALGKPTILTPVPCEMVTVSVKKGVIDHYRIGKKDYEPRDIWHERQYTLPGLHVGLSPIAYAAQSIGSYLSAQQFALDWFSNGAFPGSILKNTSKTLRPDEATAVKKKFQTTVQSGEPFVTGMDWDYKMIQATAAESAFLESMQYSINDIARFFNVPADLLDANTKAKGGKIVYANITQFNLEFLILHLQPAIARRERALSTLLSKPLNVRFKTDELLRMDPAGVAVVQANKINSRQITPSEARAQDNRSPYTESQLAEFDRLFGKASAKESPDISQELPPEGANDGTENQN